MTYRLWLGVWLGPGIIADKGNANQTKVNLLLRRQFSLNCCKIFLSKAPCQYLPKTPLIAFLR